MDVGSIWYNASEVISEWFKSHEMSKEDLLELVTILLEKPLDLEVVPPRPIPCKINIPDSITIIGDYALSALDIESLNGNNIYGLAQNAFSESSIQNHGNFFDKIEFIDPAAFDKSVVLKPITFKALKNVVEFTFKGMRADSIILPVVESLGAGLVNDSTINSFYIGKSCTEINNTAFSGYTGVINCEFAEGAVTGAPWGASETAIINYNVPIPE